MSVTPTIKGYFMRRVLVIACILALSGIAFAQEQRRYLVPFVQCLRTGGPIHSATVITVVNQSSQPCTVQVEWFQSGGALECTREIVVPAAVAVQFCSRTLPNNITNCGSAQTTCAAQDFNVLQGTAFVGSSVGFACSAIAVDARVYYTNIDDTVILAVSNSRVVFSEEGNIGD
jgi:hypothetical protein